MEVEEVEDGPFNPLLDSALPRSFEELDLCINAVNKNLQELAGRTIPPWRSTLPAIGGQMVYFNGLEIDLPKGSFFYPCSGEDANDAINFFEDTVTEFHFADPFHPLHKSLSREQRPKPRDTIFINHLGNLVNHTGASHKIGIKGRCVISHQKDGVLTLLDDLPQISVFYYRGDSAGEGGSDQRWCFPVLLDLVLSRMLDGGVFCCDGSNGAGFLFNRLRALPIGSELQYRNLRLISLATNLSGIKGPMTVWQVSEKN